MLISRVMAEQASFVCRVLRTRCPVSAAWIAIRAVSSSRISPTMMMSSITKTLEFGIVAIIRRMSFVLAATICTCRLVSPRISSIKNRFDGSETAIVNTSRIRNNGSTRFFSMYSRGRTSTIFGSNSRASSLA